MIKHIWSILCTSSVIDSDTNVISFRDILEHLDVKAEVKGDKGKEVKYINIPLQYEIVSMWYKKDKGEDLKGKIELEIVNPEGKVEKNFLQDIELTPGKKRLRSRMKIQGFAISMSGDYIFRVKMKEGGQKEFKIVAQIPLEIDLSKVNSSNKIIA